MVQSWMARCPPRKVVGWVVFILLASLSYYVLWKEHIPVDPFHPSKLASVPSLSYSQCSELLRTKSDASQAPTATPSSPHGGRKGPEYYMDMPREYVMDSEEDKLCDQYYTVEYVYGIANSSRPLCEDGSLIHSFYVPTHPHHHKLNLATDVYLMQAVQWSPQQHKFAAQCPVGTDMPTIYGSPLHFVEYGAPASSTCRRDSSEERKLVIYPGLKETYENIWHKLMELLQNKISYDAVRIALDPKTGKPFLTPSQIAGAQVVFPDEHVGPWDDEWQILTGKPPIRWSELPEGCYDVVVATVGWGGPFWSALLKLTYETCRRETLLSSFTRWLFQFYKITERPASDIRPQPTITVVQRSTSRKFRDFDSLLEKMHAQHPGYGINVVDLALMSKREQVALAQNTDVLVGHHGAGMTFTIFMRPDTAVVEILPPHFLSRGFRTIARMRGLVHFLGQAMWKEEFRSKHEGVPLPKGWKPKAQGDGDALDWQKEEWIWITHEEVLGLVDAAVKSQLLGKGDQPLS